MRNSYYNYRNVIAILKSTQGLTLRGMNEQTVNQLNIRLNKNHSFTAAESAILFYIAMQCPASGGSAVFAARALYATLNDTIGFDDGYLCANEEWYFRKDENNIDVVQTIKVFPNPANEAIYVTGLIPNDINSVEVINSLGMRLTQITSIANNAVLDVAKYPNGIYFIRVSNSERTETFKLNINR